MMEQKKILNFYPHLNELLIFTESDRQVTPSNLINKTIKSIEKTLFLKVLKLLVLELASFVLYTKVILLNSFHRADFSLPTM